MKKHKSKYLKIEIPIEDNYIDQKIQLSSKFMTSQHKTSLQTKKKYDIFFQVKPNKKNNKNSPLTKNIQSCKNSKLGAILKQAQQMSPKNYTQKRLERFSKKQKQKKERQSTNQKLEDKQKLYQKKQSFAHQEKTNKKKTKKKNQQGTQKHSKSSKLVNRISDNNYLKNTNKQKDKLSSQKSYQNLIILKKVLQKSFGAHSYYQKELNQRYPASTNNKKVIKAFFKEKKFDQSLKENCDKSKITGQEFKEIINKTKSKSFKKSHQKISKRKKIQSRSNQNKKQKLIIDIDEANNCISNINIPKTVPHKMQCKFFIGDKKKIQPQSTKNQRNKLCLNSLSQKNWNYLMEKINKQSFLLYELYQKLKNEKDPYDTIRQYVDFIQEDNFDVFIRFLKNSEGFKIIKENFILERWIILVIFYLFLEKKNKLINKLISSLIIKVIQNFKIYLKSIIEISSSENKISKNRKFLLKNFIEKQKLFSIEEFSNIVININLMNKNNKEFFQFLIDSSPLLDLKIAHGIKEMNKNTHLMGIDDSLDFLLDCFCDYFVEKGIVTVEFCDYEKEMQQKHNELEIPFLKTKPKKPYTLVLDLDETLIHFDPIKNNGKANLRPYVREFIQGLSEYFEIIVFTAAQQDYADWIIDLVDQNKNISYRFYRQHTYYSNKVNIKDLEKIGRCLSKTIIVDNLEENFQNQKQNGILIKSWYDDQDDKELQILYNLLIKMIQKSPQDIRLPLKNIKTLFERK